MGDALSVILVVIVVLAVVVLLVSGTFLILFNIIESVYLMIFNRPVYVHFYPLKKDIKLEEKYLLEKEFSFYRNLSDTRKKYFRHRVHCFMSKYTFLGRGGLAVTPQMQLLVAATWVMLTFGMRRYLQIFLKL